MDNQHEEPSPAAHDVAEQHTTQSSQKHTTADPSAFGDGTHVQADHTRLLKFMGLILLASTIFGWGSIPLYRLVCAKFAGGGSAALNGESSEYNNVTVDTSRNVHVRFSAVVNRNLPWDFAPEVLSVDVHPGEKRLTNFHAKNRSSTQTIIGKAVYDIVPAQAAPYFKKIECFCFTEQTLNPNEAVEMPLYFWFEPDMPAHIKEVTLAYSFFMVDVKEDSAPEAPVKTAQAGTL